MKKVLVNAYLAKNLGDDLFLKILFDRYPNVQWILKDYTIRNGANEYKKIFKSYKNIKYKNLLSSKYKILQKVKLKFKIKDSIERLVNECDAGIYIGGSIFMQIPQWESQYNYRKDLINTFNKNKKPYYILGANFGPYNEEKFVELYNGLFEKCTDVSFRDEYSYSIFKEIANVRKNPDIVFQLKYKNNIKVKNSIGISVIDVNTVGLSENKNDYQRAIKEIIENAISIGKSITLFSFCEHLGDINIINEIINTLNKECRKKVRVKEYKGDIDDFLQEFSSMESIIASRFHACILSQVFKQGLYPLIYSNKTYNALQDIGLDKQYIYIKDIKNINTSNILSIINDNKINDTNIFNDSEKHFEMLDKFLNKKENL